MESRIENLRRELAAETDPETRAATLCHVAALYEHELGQTPKALEHYEQAQATAAGFQPAWIGRLRIAERLENEHELQALRSESVVGARSPALGAAAMLELALHSDAWAALLREAIDRSPAPVVPALILEWMGEAHGDADAVRCALRAQAEHATDPSLQSALWLDLALSELDANCPEAAIDALEQASNVESLAWQARSLQLRLAKELEHWEVFVHAATSLAGLLIAKVPDGASSGALCVPVPEEERLPMAAFLWQEAAECCRSHLGETEASRDYIRAALRVLPKRRTIWLQALQVAEQLGDPEAIRSASEWFQAEASDDPAFVAHRVRNAMSDHDIERATRLLGELVAVYPESRYLDAALEVALSRGDLDAPRVERLQAEASRTEGEDRARLLWHAAQLSTRLSGTPREADSLYSDAISAAIRSKARIVREALGAALAAKKAEPIIERIRELMRYEIEPGERALLEFAQYDITQNLLGAEREAERLLCDAVSDANNHDWAPHIARARAAREGDEALLSSAHETLADMTAGQRRTEHLVAAARSHVRTRDWETAERLLRDALHEAPADPLVLSWLQGVLREAGRPEDVLSLTQQRPGLKFDGAVGEASLLLTGAAAEQEGKLDVAQRAYARAASLEASSPSAALALLDIARRQGDARGIASAYGKLASCGLGGGVAERYALLHGDALIAATGAPSGEAYEQALEHPDTALAAAAALLSMPKSSVSANQIWAAEEALADVGDSPHGIQNGFSAVYGALRASLGQEASSSEDAWLELAALAPNESLRAQALQQGLREARIARGTGASDDLFMLAQQAEDLADRQADAATALDETLAPSDDAEVRTRALERKLQCSEALGRGALDAAYCRALVEAGRGEEAVALLSDAIDERPDDLASWETLRSAARQAEQWPLVAQACERLAPFVAGSLKADLLEEAGVVRLDHLEQFPQAEDLFRRALSEDPGREVAFRRLHDLLAAREDAEALEVLVSERLALSGPKDRLELLYERARLLRGFSDRPGALEVLDELFTAEPDHPGALALAAEVHISLERWAEAVDCLRRLSRAGIPEEQRRLAHLGAADFLETHLDRKKEALEELRAVDALGLADGETWERIGALELEMENRGAAVDAYSRALDAEPTHRVAVSALIGLLGGAEVDRVVATYERALWERIEGGELDAALLDGVTQAAVWAGPPKRAAAARATQVALGLRPREEPTALDLRGAPLGAIFDPPGDPLLQELVRLAGPALPEARVGKKNAGTDGPLRAELETLCTRFGSRAKSVAISDELSGLVARADRDAQIDWWVPSRLREGLDEAGRFAAGRLCWAAPHGAAGLLDDSPEKVVALLAAVLLGSGCALQPGGPAFASAPIKPRRATRKAIQSLMGGVDLERSSLLELARSLQRSADRAGLVASGDIAAALHTLLRGRVDLPTLRSSSRGLDLLRFWLAAESPLWRNHVG